MVFCRACGKELHETAPTCPHCGAVQLIQKVKGQDSAYDSSNNGGSFQWYLKVLRKYAVFGGRARRKEYWYFTLYSFVIYIAFMIIGAIVGGKEVADILSSIYSLAVLVPSIAVGVRRLHDTDRSGWWLLLPIVNLIFLCSDTKEGSNRFGLNPKTVS